MTHLGAKLVTDGSCLKNPGGAGGWACRLYWPDGHRQEISGGVPSSTNNRMELVAVIRGLELLPAESMVQVWTDSEYVRMGIETWIKKWKRNGWQTSDGHDVKNQDLWLELNSVVSRLLVSWRWVRGHGSDPDNIWCDEAARAAAVGNLLQDHTVKPRLVHRSILMGVLRELAAVEPSGSLTASLVNGFCPYCHMPYTDQKDPVEVRHHQACPWVRARELTSSSLTQ